MHIVIKSFIVAGGSKQSNIMNYVLSTSRTSGKKYRRNGVGPNSEGLPFGSPFTVHRVNGWNNKTLTENKCISAPPSNQGTRYWFMEL